MSTTRRAATPSARAAAPLTATPAFVETSARYLDFRAAESRRQRTAGNWLLDPEDPQHRSGASRNITGVSHSTALIAPHDRRELLRRRAEWRRTVIVDPPRRGYRRHTVNARYQSAGLTATLELKAHNDINVNNPITSSSGILNMTFLANQDSTGGGVTNITSNLNPNGGTINIPSGTANWSAGSAISNGILSVATGATLNINDTVGGGLHQLSGVTVNNAGTVNYRAPGPRRELMLNSGSVFNNLSGAVFDSSQRIRVIRRRAQVCSTTPDAAEDRGRGYSGLATRCRHNTNGTVDIGSGRQPGHRVALGPSRCWGALFFHTARHVFSVSVLTAR